MELTITASTLFGEMWPIQHSPKRNLCNCGLFAPGRLLSLPPTQVGLADLRTIFCQTRASPGLVAARWRAQRAGWGDYTCSVLATAPPTPDPPSLRFGGRVSEPAIALATAADPSLSLAWLAREGNGESHVRVIRAAAALRRDPGDVGVRILDVAGFAVDAVLRVDHEARAAPLLHPFVHRGRTIACRRSRIDVVLGGLLQPQ